MDDVHHFRERQQKIPNGSERGGLCSQPRIQTCASSQQASCGFRIPAKASIRKKCLESLDWRAPVLLALSCVPILISQHKASQFPVHEAHWQAAFPDVTATLNWRRGGDRAEKIRVQVTTQEVRRKQDISNWSLPLK